MSSKSSTLGWQALSASMLITLSVLPYAFVYGVDRVLEVPSAATAAVWPAAIFPLLLVIGFIAYLAWTHIARPVKLATVDSLSPQRSGDRAA